jgi:predicted membrane channel-forming protein YqfA (hemolysin III family)
LAENSDIIAGVCVVLALLLAIFSTPVMDAIGELFLFLIEIGLLILIVATAIYGQRTSRSRG